MKIAVLSNINVNGTIRILKQKTDVYATEGYGNEIGVLMNLNSNIYQYAPDIVFLVEDLQELTGHETRVDKAEAFIKQWFSDMEVVIRKNIIYYISDTYCFGTELSVLVDSSIKYELEYEWLRNLKALCEKKSNVRIFPYRELIEKNGADVSFSMKMWYMGKILHSSSMQRILAEAIFEKVKLEETTPKKLLLLDLDNTLWGGLAGENDITPIDLSEDHSGLAYKNLQRVVLQMKRQGVMLGIVSKNNEKDAMQIINEHPHMVLRDGEFVIKRINWKNKNENIISIAEELNIGLDSIVFFDDNPAERQLIKEFLPQVEVPDFPERPENLADAMIGIWKQYFNRAVITEEDQSKTEQYAANVKREELKHNSESFEEYLEGLNIVLIRKNANKNVERILQLLNKTNQFNCTTKRHTINDVQGMIDSPDYEVFAYQAEDRFGDNGIIAAVILNLQGETPVIDEFVMSCRVMGKNIEYAIIDDIEEELMDKGYSSVIGKYEESPKNMPVSDLYERLGYEIINNTTKSKEYRMTFSNRCQRIYRLEKRKEENS